MKLPKEVADYLASHYCIADNLKIKFISAVINLLWHCTGKTNVNRLYKIGRKIEKIELKDTKMVDLYCKYFRNYSMKR